MSQSEAFFDRSLPVYQDDEFRARLYDVIAKTGASYRKRGAMLILFSFPAVIAGFFLRSASAVNISVIGTALVLLGGLFLFLGFMIRFASPAKPVITMIEFVLDRAEFRHVHFVPGKGGHRLHGRIDHRYKIEPDGAIADLEVRSGRDVVPDFFVPEDVYKTVKDRAKQNDGLLLIELNGDIIGVLTEDQKLIAAGEEATIAV